VDDAAGFEGAVDDDEESDEPEPLVAEPEVTEEPERESVR